MLRKVLRNNWSLHVSAFFVAICISASVSIAIHKDLHERRLQRETGSFRRLSTLLQEKLNTFTYSLQGMGGIVVNSHYNPSLSEIRSYAEFRNFFKNFPGAIGFGFIRIVKQKDKDQYLKMMQLQDPEFRIRQLGPNPGDLYIIEAIEPIEANRPARGLDTASEKNRSLAANRAIDTGLPIITGAIGLVQVSKKTVGFLYFLPIYKGSFPKTVEERRRSIMGFSYTPILASALYEYLEKHNENNFFLSLKDVTDSPEGEILFSSGKHQGPHTLSDLVNVGGRTWRLEAVSQQSSSDVFLVVLIFLSLGGFLHFCSYHFLRSFIRATALTEKLDSVEAWQTAVLDHTELSMIATDKRGLITIFNKGAEKLLGYSASEVVGVETPEMFHLKEEVIARNEILQKELGIKTPPGFDTLVSRPLITGHTETLEWNYVRKDSTLVPVSLSVRCIQDKQGEVTGYLSVAEDLTHKKELELLVEKQRSAMTMAAKFSALGELSGNVAHEINNPLAIIAGKVQVLELLVESDQLEKEFLQAELKGIEATVFRASSIVKGLKNFARDGSRDPMVPVPASQLINDVLDICSERMRIHQVQISRFGNESPIIRCRPVEISQVLMNLIGNAFDAVKESAIRKIQIRTETWDNNCLIRISNTGPRIPDDVADKMFEPFFTTKGWGKGSGLGLSISKGIIEAHGGHLTYEPHAPDTVFLIELPLSASVAS